MKAPRPLVATLVLIVLAGYLIYAPPAWAIRLFDFGFLIVILVVTPVLAVLYALWYRRRHPA
ncbi:MAG: hypothetical protein WEF51_06250 [Chloroflexota bacterium]